MKITELRAHSIAAEQVPPEMVEGQEVWQVTYIDKATGDVIFIRFNRETRDSIIAQLHGSGLILADKLPPAH